MIILSQILRTKAAHVSSNRKTFNFIKPWFLRAKHSHLDYQFAGMIGIHHPHDLMIICGIHLYCWTQFFCQNHLNVEYMLCRLYQGSTKAIICYVGWTRQNINGCVLFVKNSIFLKNLTHMRHRKWRVHAT